MYTSLLQKRIADAVDDDIFDTQFGFRKKKSTVIPIGCVKRILEQAEGTKNPCFLVFLDWEKAFDRIKQDKLLESLQRMNFPDIYRKAIKSIYTNPQFSVRMNDLKSTWRKQERGIRQGCQIGRAHV